MQRLNIIATKPFLQKPDGNRKLDVCHSKMYNDWLKKNMLSTEKYIHPKSLLIAVKNILNNFNESH